MKSWKTFVYKIFLDFFFQINSWHSVDLIIKVELKMVSMPTLGIRFIFTLRCI